MEAHIRLAKSLDGRLLRFFTRFPPPQLRGTASAAPSVQVAENTSSIDSNANTPPRLTSGAPAPSSDLINAMDPAIRKNNPFLPFKNPQTGNWHSPYYSLRRQAVLFKLAKEHNVLELMPLSPKHPEVKEQKRLGQGLRMKGIGVGQKVKGKRWERTLGGRLEERRKAMEAMPEMIRQWKERGHGRGWKKWPSGRAR